MLAKTAAVIVVELLQIVVLVLVALALGWSPHGNPLTVALLVVLGTAAFSGLGLLMAGDPARRGDAGRGQPGLPAAARAGRGRAAGLGVPRERPAAAGDPADHRPDRRAAVDADRGGRVPLGAALVLVCWAVLALAAAACWFRWE